MSGYEHVGVQQFDALHGQVVGLLGHLAPLDITQAVGLRLDQERVTVTATLEPPTVVETRTMLRETPHGEQRDTVTNVIRVETQETGPPFVVVDQKQDTEAPRQPAKEDGTPSPRLWTGRPDRQLVPTQLLRVFNRVQSGIGELVAAHGQIMDSDAQRR